MRGRAFQWIGLAVIFALLSYSIFRFFAPQNILFTGDIAVSLGVARHGLRGDFPLLGQPSHYSGRHLGPIYYYYLMLCSFLSGQDAYMTVSLFSIVKLAAVILGAMLAWFCSGSRRSLIFPAGFLLACFSSGYIWELYIPWVNNFLLLPSILCFSAFFLILKNGKRHLGFFILAASFLIQSFLGSAPVLAVLGSLGLIAIGWKGRKGAPESNSILGKANLFFYIFVLLIWIPPLIWEVNYPSNILKLFRAHLEKDAVGAAFSEIFQQTKFFFFVHWIGLDLAGKLEKAPLSAVLLTGLPLVLVVLDYLKKAAGSVRYFWGAVLLACGVCLLSLRAVSPPLYSFYFNALLPLPALIFSVVFGHSIELVGGIEKDESAIARLVQASGILSLLMLCFLSGYNIFKANSAPPYVPVKNSLKHVQEIAVVIKQDAEDVSDLKIITRGADRHRRSAFYYFLNKDVYHRMSYAPYFKEIPIFKRVRVRIGERFPVKQPERGYLLGCFENDNPDRMARSLNQIKRDWIVTGELSLKDCTTCKGCSLFRLKHLKKDQNPSPESRIHHHRGSLPAHDALQAPKSG